MVGLSRPLVFCLKLDSAFEHAHLETPLSMSVCVAVLGEPFSNQAYDSKSMRIISIIRHSLKTLRSHSGVVHTLEVYKKFKMQV
jgi:spore maturation protein SpmB